MRTFALLVSMLCSTAAFAGPERDAPRGESPKLWLASASEEKGNVVIQLASPVERLAGGGPGGFEPGVRSLPPTTVMSWDNLRTVTLGRTVEAFRANGERAGRDHVLKSLAKPKGVAVFVRTAEQRPKLESFYLSLLRDDVLVLTVRERDIYPEGP